MYSLPGYDAWKTAYPAEWDYSDEVEQEIEEENDRLDLESLLESCPPAETEEDLEYDRRLETMQAKWDLECAAEREVAA